MTGPECSVDVAAHCVEMPVDGEQCSMVGSTADLLEEGGEGVAFRLAEDDIVVLFSNARLAVLVAAHKHHFVDVHTVIIKPPKIQTKPLITPA